ncbi:MAG: hypothetical protein ACNA7G_10830 [Methylobacter sp.]
MSNSASLDNELPEPYNVTFFVVSNDEIINGCRYQSYISPLFATIEQARAFKADAIEQYPDCYCGGGTAFYRGENDSNRLELLAAIVPAAQISDTKKPA